MSINEFFNHSNLSVGSGLVSKFSCLVKKNRKAVAKKLFRLSLGVSLALAIASCASIKRLIPISELKPEDLEPRVEFIDQQVVEVETSQIKGIDAEQVVKSYERLLNRGNPTIRREALHRLADLTMRLAEAKMSASESSSQSNLTPAMRDASFNKAIQLYQTLLNEHPDYKAIDEVKYQLARAHSLNADPESSLKVLDQIAVVHVESNSYVESQFRRGESYFVRKQYQVAEKAYGEVITKGVNTQFYDKALYKRGWSLFKQSLFLEAQQDFFKLYERLLYQQKHAANKNKLTDDLIVDTGRVISLAFYNMDGADSVKKYFETYGRQPFEDQIYAGLAELYIEQERFQDAADTYMGFINRNPLSLSSPEFHSRVIEVYRKGGFPSLILPAKESFVVNYGRQSAFWQKYSGKVIDDLKPLLRLHLDDVSKFYHAAAQKSKKPADYLVAAKWYREILATFTDPQIDSQYRFLLAETLTDGGDLLQSAKEYEIVAYKNAKSKFSRDAGYRALVAYQGVTHPKNATTQEKLLPSILSGLKFSSTFSNDAKAPEILSRVAEQQLSINDVQGAIDSSNKLLVLPAKPNKKQAERAKIIIANGLFDLKRYAEAEVAITQLLNTVQLSKKQRAEFRQRRVESVYKLAENAKAENKLDESINLFLKVKQLEPSSKIAINAHFDAATLLLQTEKWQRASQLLESFRKAYPKNELSKTIPEKLALVYEKQQDWNKAAKEYITLAENQNDPQLAREGRWRVAELYLKADNSKQAIAAYKHYVWTYPSPYLLSQEGRNKLVELYEKTGDITKSHFWRQKIVEFYAKNKSENNTRTTFLAAESKFILSESLFSQFKKIKLKLPLAKSLKKKRAAMKKALSAYNSIAKYNVAKFTTASTHKVAQIYHLLSKDLMASQKPKGLSEDELEEYGYLLEEQALPFEDKAINFYEVNAQRTVDKIYDDSVKASINELKLLKPAQYDKSERLEALPDVHF
ncbi:tetratricopeptide repeat protein [Aliikangiella coralliicola]|uniref:Tetratricopeptide repeat protein n=1 Tax=Aliikangiella coralliicola TaxID=2592383 RepID=A0A545U510_9GAMM|nr:tetratricopeptide repeat protein [Aliikangiella coralliicola]TQV84542.1 tetratricopeptide repeat protein [Aliikangiella coralliicola]